MGVTMGGWGRGVWGERRWDGGDDGGLGEGVWGERRWDGGDDGGLGEGVWGERRWGGAVTEQQRRRLLKMTTYAHLPFSCAGLLQSDQGLGRCGDLTQSLERVYDKEEGELVTRF